MYFTKHWLNFYLFIFFKFVYAIYILRLRFTYIIRCSIMKSDYDVDIVGMLKRNP